MLMMSQNSSHGRPRRRRLPQRNGATPFLAGPVAAKYPVHMWACTYKFTGGREGETLQSRQKVEVNTGKRGKSTRDKEKAGYHDGFNQRVQDHENRQGPPMNGPYRAGAWRLVGFCATLHSLVSFSL